MSEADFFERLSKTQNEILVKIAEIQKDLQAGEKRFIDLESHHNKCIMNDPMAIHSVKFLTRSEGILIELIGEYNERKNNKKDIKKSIVNNIIDLGFKIIVSGAVIVWGIIKILAK